MNSMNNRSVDLSVMKRQCESVELYELKKRRIKNKRYHLEPINKKRDLL